MTSKKLGALLQSVPPATARVAPEVGETACYWPDADLTDMLVREDVLALAEDVYNKLFGEFRTLCGDRYTPEIR